VIWNRFVSSLASAGGSEQAGAGDPAARQLLAATGPERVGQSLPGVLDLHSTTAAMGKTLWSLRAAPADLALAAGIQGLLGLPIYLHEGRHDSQHGS